MKLDLTILSIFLAALPCMADQAASNSVGVTVVDGYYTPPRTQQVAFAASQPATIMHLLLRLELHPYRKDRNISIVRTDDTGHSHTNTLDVRQILRDGDPSKDDPLRHGDRVVFPTRRVTLFDRKKHQGPTKPSTPTK